MVGDHVGIVSCTGSSVGRSSRAKGGSVDCQPGTSTSGSMLLLSVVARPRPGRTPLEVQPELGSHAQSPSDSQGRVWRDAPAAVDDAVDAYLGHPYRLASRYWVMPSSFMIFDRCSPRWIGSGGGP